MRVFVDLAMQRAVVAVGNMRHGPEAWRPLAPRPELVSDGVVERLRTPRDAVAFLRALDVAVPAGQPTADQLLRLRDVRDAARSLAEGDRRAYARRCARIVRGVTLSLDADGALRVAGSSWDAFADELAVALVTLGEQRRRLKICHNPACAWLFIDRTRNASQVWCSEQLCGDRLRVRRARRRASR